MHFVRAALVLQALPRLVALLRLKAAGTRKLTGAEMFACTISAEDKFPRWFRYLTKEGGLKQSHFLTAFSPIAQNQPSSSVAHCHPFQLVPHTLTALFTNSLAQGLLGMQLAGPEGWGASEL